MLCHVRVCIHNTTCTATTRPAVATLPIVSSADQRRGTNRPTDAEVAPSVVARCAIAMDRCLAGWLVHCSTRRRTAQLAEYRPHCGCLMHFARLANTHCYKTKKVHETITLVHLTLPNIHRFYNIFFAHRLSNKPFLI